MWRGRFFNFEEHSSFDLPDCEENPNLTECLCQMIKDGHELSKNISEDIGPKITQAMQPPNASTGTLHERSKLAHVLIFNVGLWPAAWGSSRYWQPNDKFSELLHVVLDASKRYGYRAFWRTTSSVHRANFDGCHNKTLFSYLNQPRIDKINYLASKLLQSASVPIIDVSTMTRLSPELLKEGDMMHFKDEMYAEMLQVVAREICPLV